MQISWDDVNRTEITGLHFVARLGIDVFVTQGAVARWKVDPACHHEVLHIATSLGKMYSLGLVSHLTKVEPQGQRKGLLTRHCQGDEEASCFEGLSALQPSRR